MTYFFPRWRWHTYILQVGPRKRELSASSTSLADILQIFELIYEEDSRTGLLKSAHLWSTKDVEGVQTSPWLGSYVSLLNFGFY